MAKKFFITALLAGVLAAPAHAQFSRALLMPGVTYERQVQFTSHGPVAIHVLTAPRPRGAYALRPVLSNGAITGRARVTAMQAHLSREYTVAGVNGDLFSLADGRPSGVLIRSGVVDHPPLPERSSIGITADGTLRIERVQMFGTWRGTGQRRGMDLNRIPGANGFALFTPSWGPVTPSVEGSLEAVVHPLPPTVPGEDLQGPVIELTQGGNTPIPAGGAVLLARGTGAQRLAEEAAVGASVVFRILLNPDWTGAGVTEALGGGPVLARDGKPVFRHFELFSTAELARSPRTAVGQLADGRIILVVVDGRRRGYSVGMTNFELAQTMVRLGAVTASGLDAGGSSTLAFDGELLNRPSDPGGERPVAQCLCLLYSGIYAPPPGEDVLSPNGDGVAETQTFSYKVTRPSTVTVSLVGPDGAARKLESGPKAPGTYRLTWNATSAGGQAEPEGRWRLNVTGVDEGGGTTTADRVFAVNRTLAGLTVRPVLVRVRPKRGGILSATFRLGRPATVTALVETPTGAVIAVAARKRLGAGTQTLTWDGKVGGSVAATGRYVLRIVAVNELGRTELTRPFMVRRIASPRETRG